QDILKALGQLDDDRRPFLIGFAAETQNLEEYAMGKLRSKRADVVVGNIVKGPDSAFGADRSSVLLVDGDGRQQRHGPAPKEALAQALWTFASEHARWPDPTTEV
ncbi:MAG: phosphopantothenoylcysteine decarboxylase, partial [Myxococcota bacterium]